jgi:TatD DNase family protein
VHDAVIEWFDSHCHLQREFTETGDETSPGPHATRLAGIIARAAEAGVSRMVCIGTGAESSNEAVALVRTMRRPDSVAVAEGVELWATVGLHPHDAVDGIDAVEDLLWAELDEEGSKGEPAGDGEQDRDQPVVVGIGECGLDYHYDHSPRPVQREMFERQVALAHRYRTALVIHTREAWDDTVDILASSGVPERTVVHCFTGGPEEARRCLDLGTSLSFSGVVTFKNAADVREAAALCPMDRLLVETDAPFLAPVPHRGSLNEPSRVPLIGAMIAQVKGVRTEEVAQVSTRNARALFALEG